MATAEKQAPPDLNFRRIHETYGAKDMICTHLQNGYLYADDGKLVPFGDPDYIKAKRLFIPVHLRDLVLGTDWQETNLDLVEAEELPIDAFLDAEDVVEDNFGHLPLLSGEASPSPLVSRTRGGMIIKAPPRPMSSAKTLGA